MATETTQILWPSGNRIIWPSGNTIGWPAAPEPTARIYKRDMPQYATYWEPTNEVDANTRERRTTPGRTVRCRWEQSDRLYKDDSGQEFVVEATIFLPFIPKQKAFIALGRNQDLSRAKQITRINRQPDLRGTVEVVSALIARQ